VHNSAGKMCPHALLPERPERPHFAVAAGTMSPSLLTVQYTVHFAEWSDVSKTVWIFRGPEPRVLLVHEPVEVEMCYITKTTGSLLWRCTAAQTVRIPDRTHISAASLPQWHLYCHKTTGLGKKNLFTVNRRSSTLYAILRSARCLPGCQFLTFPPPVVPTFSVQTVEFFWIFCIFPLAKVPLVYEFTAIDQSHVFLQILQHISFDHQKITEDI
jgi:hypothetical protein